MEDEEKVNDELKRISPSFPPAASRIPGGYFDELPDRIMERVSAEIPVQPGFRVMWRKWLAIAAVFAGLLITLLLVLPKKGLEPQPISSLEAYQYIEEHIDEFETLLEAEVASMPAIATDPEADVIEDYLLDELEGADAEIYFK